VTTAALFQQGLAHHQAGRLAEADACYRQLLAREPAHADSLHLLGVIAHQLGRNEAAVEAIGRAIAAQPRVADYHSNLGNVLRALGRLDPAVASYRAALALKPDYPVAQYNLGNALRDLGRAKEAEAGYRQAVRLKPDFAEAHHNLGTLLREDGRLAEAERHYRAALRGQPGNPAWHCALGDTLRAQDRPEAAVACYRTALGLKPDYPEALNNLGNALRALDRPAEAEAAYRQALGLKPGFVDAQANLAILLMLDNRLDEAVEACRATLRLDPDHAVAHANLGVLLLRAGRLAEGWPEYEWRWRVGPEIGLQDRGFSQPRWTGEALGGRVLLIHAEQGYGDTIQFCRYLSLAAAYGRVVLEVPRPLLRLLSDLPGIERIVATGDPLPEFDLHCPLLSLPGVFGTTLDTIPATVPYLAADPSGAMVWRDRLAALPGLRVGLVWAGNPARHVAMAQAVDRRRSIGLAQLAPFAAIHGVTFVSLQKGEAAGAVPLSGMVVHDWTDELTDFADTAALVQALDLVISVDTAVAHLAGALGKPVWLLNRFDTCWRWLADRDDSPWYPTLRQFRQPRPGDWDSVLDEVRAALATLA